MKNTFLLLLLLSFVFFSFGQDSKVQMKFGKYFADISLDSSELFWKISLNSSRKFKLDTSFKFPNKIYQIVEVEGLKNEIPELHHAFITFQQVQYTMQQGKFIDTFDLLVVRYNLTDSLTKETAKKVYKRLRKTANSVFLNVREYISNQSNQLNLHCSYRPFATIADIHICIVSNKETHSYAVALTFAKRKE